MKQRRSRRTDLSVPDATSALDELTDTVASYIRFCEEVCVPTTKSFRICRMQVMIRPIIMVVQYRPYYVVYRCHYVYRKSLWVEICQSVVKWEVVNH